MFLSTDLDYNDLALYYASECIYPIPRTTKICFQHFAKENYILVLNSITILGYFAKCHLADPPKSRWYDGTTFIFFSLEYCNKCSTELEVKHSVTINKVFHFTRKVIEWTNNLILEPDHLQMTLLNWKTESRSFLMLYTSFFSHEIMAMKKSYLPEDFLIKTILVATQTSSKFDFKNYHKISLK